MSEAQVRSRRVLVFGASGTIGLATARELARRGHDVVCFVRSPNRLLSDCAGVTCRMGDVTNPEAVVHDAFAGEHFDAVVSCLASRTGTPDDARAIDYAANCNILAAAKANVVCQLVLVSAICVQRPRLAFQHAKLAFERELIQSGLIYSIVRPTAFFKSLSGQVERVKRGKSFLVIGDGSSTACKPISDGDLARYLADCLDDIRLHNRILPIGGPGDALTPEQQGKHLFHLLHKEPRFRRVPLALFDVIIGVLTTLSRVMPKLAVKAELARIGRYYATESMLVFNPVTNCYDAAATPSTGTETLFEYYERVIAGTEFLERGEHAVF